MLTKCGLLIALSLIITKSVQAKDYVKISNCLDNEEQINFAPSEIVEIAPEWESDEKELVHNYEWKYKIAYNPQVELNRTVSESVPEAWLEHMSNTTQKIVIPAHTLLPNYYNVTVISKRKPSVQTGPDNALENGTKVCRITMQTLRPFAIISGGLEKVVPVGSDILVNGDESIDQNFSNFSNKDFKYKWSCNQTKQPPTFCKKDPISNNSHFTIPSQDVHDGDVITITLNVSLGYVVKEVFKVVTQEIVVKTNAPSLEITKNCISWTYYSNYEMITLFEVSCSKNCQGIRDDDYVWSVEEMKNPSYTFDYSKSRYGKTGTKFLLEKNVLTNTDWYIVKVQVNTTHGSSYTSLKLKYRSPTEINDCQLNPSEGKSMETYFQFSCTQKRQGQNIFYEFYVRDVTDISMERLVASGFRPDIFNRMFKLPPSEGKSFIVRATIIAEYSLPVKEVQVQGRVVSALSQKSSTEVVKILDYLYNGNGTNHSIINLVRSDSTEDRNKAIEIFQTIVDELVVSKIQDPEMKDFLMSLKYTASEDMLKAPLESLQEIMKITHSLTELHEKNVPAKSDPLLAKFTTTVCKKMAERTLDMMRKEKSPLQTGDRMQKFSTTVARCFETTTNPDFDIVKPIEMNIITEAAIFEEPMLTESYANYVDHDESYYKNLDYLQEASYNIINGSSTAGKVIAMGTATGEGLVRTFGNQSENIIFKDTGSELIRSSIHAKEITVNCSKDFENDQHSYDFIMTTWNKDFLWWNPGFIKVYTNVINLEFWHSTCKKRIDSFKKPVHIYFTIKKERIFTAKTTSYSFSIPQGYATMSNEELNHHIQVQRIVLPTKRMLYINFHGLNSTDVFDVVLLANKFPDAEDFINKEIVKLGNNYSLQLPNNYNYNIIVYVGILVNKEAAVENTTITYHTSAAVTCCIRFVPLESKWVPTCKVGHTSNQTLLYCLCTHLSVLAGYIENIKSIPQQVIRPELEMKIWCSLIVFSTLVLNLGIFLVLLVLSLLRRKDQVYFLGDNDINHRFAYLVIIKTGEGYHAGTSSNVIIKLNGDKKFSEPHVLNYPDPQLRMLQQFGQDLFLLATESHLGNLESLELWFDSIGQNPDWFCRDIIVYDLQEHVQWYFKIEKRISVTLGTAYLVSTPINRVTLKEQPTNKTYSFMNFKTDLSLLRRYHPWYLWQHEENFSYIKKLTVILSTVLTTYSLALLLVGQPSLKLNDGFEQDVYYTLGPYSIFVVFTCSFPSFMIHIFITWCFRLSAIQFSRYEQTGKLSFRYNVACWCVLLTLIVTSTAYLTIVGFWLTLSKSLIWLTTSLTGVIIGIVFYETVFFLIAMFVYKYEIVYDVRKKFNDIWSTIEAQRDYLFATFGERLLRPYFEHLYLPLRKRQTKALSVFIRHRHFVITELQDLFMFAVYVFVLYVVILAGKDTQVVRGKTQMENIIKGIHTRSVDFHEIESAYDIYHYINETLIPSIQPLRWYGKFVVSEPGLMIDVANKYIGVTRLRQHRMKSGVCKTPKSMEFVNMTCWPEFALSFTETRTFGYKWGNFSNYINFDRLKMIWKYASQGQTETFPTFGEISLYSGGGYVAYLGRTLYNSYVNFRQMLSKLWIDQAMRAIFIEFLTYNADANIFNSVRLIFEQSATGFVHKAVLVYTVRMLLVNNEVAYISTVFSFLFIIWVGLLLFKQSLGVIKHLHDFYKDPWSVIDFIIISLSVSCIVLYAVRMSFVGNYLKAMEKAKHNEFMSYFYLFYIEEYLTFAAAFLVCIATIRLWKFLRFAKMFRMMERTLGIAAFSLLSFVIIFISMVMGFGMTLFILLGNDFTRLRSLIQTVRLMLTMAFKASEMKLPEYLRYHTAIFYFILYIVALIVSMFTFITIIVLAYGKAQFEFSSDLKIYNIKDYMQERTHYLGKFFKYKSRRLRSGLMEVVETKVEPKSDKFLYLNSFSVSVFKMRCMKYVIQGFIRKHTRKTSVLSNRDVKLMEMICWQMFSKRGQNEVDIFYKGRVRGQRVKLVDEKRIEKIANVANLLLQEQGLVSFIQEERDPLLDDCLKAIKRRGSTLRHCSANLKLIVRQVTNAELQIPRN